MKSKKIVIIGGGIVGLATAYQLCLRGLDLEIIVLEKEDAVALHQTGRNSGVLHTGIYYKPGSLKAVNCRAGKLAMQEFCQKFNIQFEICGKVIIAKSDGEIPALDRILERGTANGVKCEMIGPERLRELEPHARGVRAIRVPESGIVNYAAVCAKLSDAIKSAGHGVRLAHAALSIGRAGGDPVVHTNKGEFAADLIVNCAGLHCDRVAAMSGARPEAKIIPFRGEYYEVAESRRFLCKNLIYPVPDPKFPFLGVHFTRMIGGHVECGPNAVLAFAREGYKKTDINIKDLFETLGYPGFRRMARKHWRMGLGEMWRSFSKKAFTRALQGLIPEIRESDLSPAPAGIRAQAVAPDGDLVDDFKIQEGGGIIHVLNAPSPAATASLNIGKIIAERAAARLTA
ncbi:MAG: L-2-hydroxyglutarate oxidase [Planctomycetes bacterium]|nr:L-2-hydroxyglutarate oxidase [Planctomycetota bacterium]